MKGALAIAVILGSSLVWSGCRSEATWTDDEAGLAWQNPPADTQMNWEAAKEYCASLDLDGGGWRLPVVEELYFFLFRNCPIREDCTPSPQADDCFWRKEMQGECDAYWSSTAGFEDDRACPRPEQIMPEASLAGELRERPPSVGQKGIQCGYGDVAWVVTFSGGGTRPLSIGDNAYVRCVR